MKVFAATFVCLLLISKARMEDQENEINPESAGPPLMHDAPASIQTGQQAETKPEDEKTTTTTNTPKTTPEPHLNDHWKVTDIDTGKACIHLAANVTLAIKYPIGSGNETELSAFVDIDILDGTVDDETSNCSEIDYNKNISAQLLSVRFSPEGDDINKDWRLNLWFTNDTKVSGGKAFVLYQINITANLQNRAHLFPNYTQEEPMKYSAYLTSTHIGAGKDRCMKCSDSDIKLDGTANEGKISLSQYKLQAYANQTDFYDAEVCEKDVHTSDVVPIVVGACLAGLVIIVLVAYLVGRARAKRQGYASV